MRDIYHDTNNSQFNNISFSFHPEVILDKYSSCIEVFTSNDIVLVISIKSIIHLSTNEFILVIFRKDQFLHIHIILRIKCIRWGPAQDVLFFYMVSYFSELQSCALIFSVYFNCFCI